MASEFGICTWTLGIEEPQALMAKVLALGLTTVQFHGDHATHDPLEVKQAAHTHGVSIFAIDPMGCRPKPGDTVDANHGLAYYRGVLDFARETGTDVVTAHGLGTWCCDEKDRAGAFEKLVTALQTLCDDAAESGIRILWEMCNRYELPMVRTCREGRELSARVSRTNFGLIIDSFHMNIEERDPVAEIRETGEDVSMYHISDSDRGGIGSGHVDFKAQHAELRAMGYEAPVMVEFVLRELCPTTPPGTPDEWLRMHEAISTTIATWREFDGSWAPTD